ncbi:hypothetical protein JCM5350_005205 [Sporobolomyces pararoseus]
MKRLSEVIASHTSTSRRPQDQQRLLDQIVNLISSPPQDFSHLQRLLDQLDSDKIDGLHSIIQFSPLEALLSRYPKLVQEDFKILEKLLEKGADLGKVQREILERMVEAEIDEGDEVLKVFEKRLIKEFETLDKITNEGEGNVEAESSPALDPPRHSTPGNPQRQEEIARRSPSLTPLPPSRNVSIIALSDLSQTSSHSQPHRPASVSPDTSRSLHPPSRDSPPFLPPPRSPLPLLARPDPSELIRLCTCVPEGTTMSSLWYYFHAVLRVQIFNPYLQTDRPPFHAFFKVEKRLFESGKLESRLREMAFNGSPFISVEGNRWIFTISVARESASRSNFQPRIETSKDLLFNRREGKNYGERPRDQHGWVKITLSGFSIDTKPSEIESTLQRILTYWRDFEVRSSEDGQESVVELKVRGPNAVSLVEKVEEIMPRIRKKKGTRQGGGGGEIAQDLVLVLARLVLPVVPRIVLISTPTLALLLRRGGDPSLVATVQVLDLDPALALRLETTTAITPLASTVLLPSLLLDTRTVTPLTLTFPLTSNKKHVQYS